MRPQFTPLPPASLGVVTVTFNAEKYLAPFIECCLAQDHPNYTLLVIDNASTDRTLQIVEEIADSRVRVIANEANVGYAAACNQAISHFVAAGVENILFINNDTEFDQGLFSALIQELDRSAADAITPRITYFSAPDTDWYSGGIFQFWNGFQGTHSTPNAASTRIGPTEVAPGCCVLFRLATFREIGLFDPTYFVYFEDTDLFWRMKKAGLKLWYLGSEALAHKVSLSTGGSQSDFSIRFHQRNQMYAVRKHFGRCTVALQFLAIISKATTRLLLRRDSWQQFLTRMRGIREGTQLPLRKFEVQLRDATHGQK